jgi:hypothetical protein
MGKHLSVHSVQRKPRCRPEPCGKFGYARRRIAGPGNRWRGNFDERGYRDYGYHDGRGDRGSVGGNCEQQQRHISNKPSLILQQAQPQSPDIGMGTLDAVSSSAFLAFCAFQLGYRHTHFDSFLADA